MRLRDDGTPDPETAYDVPPGAPVHECGICGAPFPAREDRELHRALVHGREAGDGVAGGDEGEEADTLEAAREREETALRRFRLKALGAVVALYFVLLMVYALV